MNNLIARELYHAQILQDETGYWRRTRWASGIFFGAFMGVVIGLPALIRQRFSFALVAFAVALLCGTFFGMFWTFSFRRYLVRLVDQCYDGVGRFAALPPSDDYDFRLPCSWYRSNNLTVGGSLYCYADEFIFVPHSGNLPRHRNPISIPKKELSLSVVPHEITGWLKLLARFFTKKMPEVLEITAQGAPYHFAVPQPTTTCDKIKSILGCAEQAQGDGHS